MHLPLFSSGATTVQPHNLDPGNIQLLNHGMSTPQVLVEEMPGLPHCSAKDGKGKCEEDHGQFALWLAWSSPLWPGSAHRSTSLALLTTS
uniref:Uncharacterized protein n=1 Tax=Arundo donax TaxID=35708 RepID=A0A0A9DZ17_ARUDO